MKNLFLALILFIFASSSFGQKDPNDNGKHGGRSRADFAALLTLERIQRGVASRTGFPKDSEILSSTGRHYILLIDTSQNSSNEVYATFLHAYTDSLLKNILLSKEKRRVKDGVQDLITILPYQLRIEDRPEFNTKAEIFDRPTYRTFVEKIPMETIKQPDYTGRGHDASGARSELIRRLQKIKDPQKREPIIIQITSLPKNQDPDHPGNDAKIRQIDSQKGLLENTGITPLGPVESATYETDPAGPNRGASNVYVWLYGVGKYKGSFQKPPVPPEDTKSSKGSLTPWLLAGAAIVVIALLFWPRHRGLIVEHANGDGSNSITLNSGESVMLCVNGSSVDKMRTFPLPTSAGGTIKSGSDVAVITYKRTGSITISPSPGKIMLVNQNDSLKNVILDQQVYQFLSQDRLESTSEVRFRKS